MRLLLIRHGEVEESWRGRCYGRSEPRLAPAGRRQADALAVALDGEPLAAIYSSPALRCRETAEVVARRRRLTVQTRAAFQEIDFGLFEGLTFDQIARDFPAEYAGWMSAPWAITFPAGESWADLCQRVAAALADLRRRHAEDTIGLVAHSGSCQALILSAEGQGDQALLCRPQHPAHVSIIDYRSDVATLVAFNRPPEVADSVFERRPAE